MQIAVILSFYAVRKQTNRVLENQKASFDTEHNMPENGKRFVSILQTPRANLDKVMQNEVLSSCEKGKMVFEQKSLPESVSGNNQTCLR